jgi:hypothetical protein
MVFTLVARNMLIGCVFLLNCHFLLVEAKIASDCMPAVFPHVVALLISWFKANAASWLFPWVKVWL